MADDLYSGRWGGLVAATGLIFFLGAFYFENLLIRNSIWVAFFLGFAVFNFLNYKRTNKHRYLISSCIFLLAFASGSVNNFIKGFISWRAIWLISITLFVLSDPIASLFRSLGILKREYSNEKP